MYFNKILLANYAVFMNSQGGDCYNNQIPSFKKAIDLYITIFSENDSQQDYFAAATPCYVS